MDENIISLSFKIYKNPGVFALFLGSGMSRSAGIPTGWDIMVDLINQLKILNNSDKDDPISWFQSFYDKPADYSNIIEQLTSTREERINLLKKYFEPTEEEFEQGLKSPTKAHDAIANLVKLGYFKVIITTNFDRLLEKALWKIGIEPVVISNSTHLENTIPLIHNKITVVKINGDYLETSFLNIKKELEKYDPEMEAFLTNVFENFGLITCGWSAQWDIGLLDILRKSNKFRFSNYFTYRGEISNELQELSKVRCGTTLKINDADSFFTELKENTLSLEGGMLQNPLNLKIAKEKIKRYLSTESHKILFNDFIYQISTSAYDEINAIEFKNPNDPKNIREAIDLMFSKIETLNQVLSISVYWANEYNSQAIVNVVKKFMRPNERSNSYAIFSDLAYIPLLIIYYTIGISSAIRGDFFLFGKIVGLKIENRHNVKSIFDLINNEFKQRPDGLNHLYGTNHKEPMSEMLYTYLEKFFEDIAVNHEEFELSFDFFEYVNNLIFMDQNQAGYGIPGRFSYRYRREWKGPLPNLVKKEINENSSLIQSGLFRDFQHLKEANEVALEYIKKSKFY